MGSLPAQYSVAGLTGRAGPWFLFNRWRPELRWTGSHVTQAMLAPARSRQSRSICSDVGATFSTSLASLTFYMNWLFVSTGPQYFRPADLGCVRAEQGWLFVSTGP